MDIQGIREIFSGIQGNLEISEDIAGYFGKYNVSLRFWENLSRIIRGLQAFWGHRFRGFAQP